MNPIYTTDTGSLFVLSVTPEEFFASSQGLGFYIKDYDKLSANDTLGKVFVHQDELLKGEGERTEYELIDSASENKKQPVSFNEAVDDELIPCSHFATIMLHLITGKACLTLPKGYR